MIKKIFGVLLCMMFVAGNCLAMTFSEPVKLGHLFSTPRGGFVFKGEHSNNGKFISYINRNEKVYEKGIAIFGEGEDALYVYYDDNKKLNVTFGSKDENNSFTLNNHMIEQFCDVWKIETDSELVLYPINIFGGSWGSSNWIILGKRSDGAFVKYIEAFDIRKKYFANPRYVDCNKIFTQGNSIIIGYKYFYPQNEHNGEFRFKWDDKAQWFGVEQVVY